LHWHELKINLHWHELKINKRRNTTAWEARSRAGHDLIFCK